jgi:hypothetical protein
VAAISDLRKRFREFFATSKSSDFGIELLEKFIIPFAREYSKRGASVDDMLADFFATDERLFFYLKATREFELPGSLFITGRKTTKAYTRVKVRKGQRMLAALDRKDETVRIEIVHYNERKNILLQRFEFEAIKDCLEVIDGQSDSFGLRDNRTKSVARRDSSRRILRRKRLQSSDDGVQE